MYFKKWAMRKFAYKKRNDFFSALSSFEKENVKTYSYDGVINKFLLEKGKKYLDKYSPLLNESMPERIEYLITNRPRTAKLLEFNPYWMNSTVFFENRFYAHWWYKMYWERIVREYAKKT